MPRAPHILHSAASASKFGSRSREREINSVMVWREAIGAGAVTYIVGPVTGAAIGASSELMALSIATGLVKAIIVMVGTPIAARFLLRPSMLYFATRSLVG